MLFRSRSRGSERCSWVKPTVQFECFYPTLWLLLSDAPPLRRQSIGRGRGLGESPIEVHDQLRDEGAYREEQLGGELDQRVGETGERHEEPEAGGEEDAGPSEECPQDRADPDHVGSMRRVRATYLSRLPINVMECTTSRHATRSFPGTQIG